MIILLCYLGFAVVLSGLIARAGHRSQVQIVSESPASPCSRVLIIGATGGTGRMLVSQALERGLRVTALVRDRSRLDIDDPQLTIVQGDVLNASTLEAAMTGQDAVLSALGHKRFLGPTKILSEGTRNILHAMEIHRVPRLICETSLGIGNSVGRLGLYYTFFVIPVILAFYFWDKTRQEQIIARSNVDWIIVRPAALTNRAKLGRIRVGRSVGSYFLTATISRADVADFMLNQLESNAYLRSAVGVCS
ncbi:MAG: SDR family oxidoreductase [FCB group bacterium]|nr:SDR family oxidoreductase [FCB group bacterium]